MRLADGRDLPGPRSPYKVVSGCLLGTRAHPRADCIDGRRRTATSKERGDGTDRPQRSHHRDWRCWPCTSRRSCHRDNGGRGAAVGGDRDPKPHVGAGGRADPDDRPSRPAGAATDTLRGLAHRGSGQVRLLELAGGAWVLRLEGLNVQNGPDLHVYLAAAPADADPAHFGRPLRRPRRAQGQPRQPELPTAGRHRPGPVPQRRDLVQAVRGRLRGRASSGRLSDDEAKQLRGQVSPDQAEALILNQPEDGHCSTSPSCFRRCRTAPQTRIGRAATDPGVRSAGCPAGNAGRGRAGCT